MRGTKRAAQRVAAELTVAPPAASAGRTVADALDAWLETNKPTWAASTVRDQTSRVSLVKADKIARTPLGRLTVADVDRWHARLRANGVGESSLRNQHLVLRAALVAGGALGMGERPTWPRWPRSAGARPSRGRRCRRPTCAP